jgi:hypothetical protein
MSWLFSKAMMEAYGNSLSSPEQAAEYSAGICLDGEQWSQLNVMPTPHKFWRNDKTMEFSRLSQFGLTLRLLTEDHGTALLTSYLAASHAKTSAQQVPAQESREPEADCGPTWYGLFARWDASESKWKTPQCSLLGDLDEFSETWPRWGSMRNGVSCLRPIPALPICASESGLWQTPVADDAIERKSGKWNSRGEPKLSAEVKLWPTPKANDAEKRGNFDVNNPRNGLPAAAKKWPTPCASASKGSSPASLTRKSGKSRANDRIDHAVMASDGGQLNPEWVEWLMGWPPGWTALKPLEMDKFHEWQQQHGGF